MNPTSFHLRFSDPELANSLATSTPPKGVRVSKPSMIIECATPAQIFVQVAISFFPSILSSLVAAWIYECLKKSGKKSGRINRKQVVFHKRDILRLIKKELSNQKARDAQRRREKHKSAK